MEHFEESRRVSFLAVFSFVWRYWMQVPYKFIGVVFGVVVSIAIEVQIPIISAELVIAIEDYAEKAGGIDVAYQAVYWLLGIFAAVSVVQQIYNRIWIRLASEVMRTMVYDGFYQVQRFSADWHANHFAGSTVRQITRGMWAYDTLADTTVIELGPALLLLIAVSISMFLREPIMGSRSFATCIFSFSSSSARPSVRCSIR